MDLQILNKDLQLVGVLDNYDSLIWANRFRTTGDFEIYCIASQQNIKLLQQDYYVTRTDDEMVGVIEAVNEVNDAEEGNYLTATGRDLKQILRRRIVWNQTTLKGTVEDCLRQLINENIINPSIASRRINNFTLGVRHGFTETMEKQVTGDNLLQVVEEICTAYDYGYKIKLVDNKFMFDVYKSTDRSYEQTTNKYIVFSPKFDNLINSDYASDNTEFCNIALVAGEGEGLARKTTDYYKDTEPTGLYRYEMYVDARDLSTNEGEITDAVYIQQLKQRGNEGLSEVVKQILFESEVQINQLYQYKRDYYLGDIVQIETVRGLTAAVKIIEIIETQDASGYSLRPTFEVVGEVV